MMNMLCMFCAHDEIVSSGGHLKDNLKVAALKDRCRKCTIKNERIGYVMARRIRE